MQYVLHVARNKTKPNLIEKDFQNVRAKLKSSSSTHKWSIWKFYLWDKQHCSVFWDLEL